MGCESMRSQGYATLPDDQLVDQFESLAIQISKMRSVQRSNQLALDEHRILVELRSRGPESSMKLLSLIGHYNPQVRLSVAIGCHDLDARLCEKTLEDLVDRERSVSAPAAAYLMRVSPPFRAKMQERYGLPPWERRTATQEEES